jgi:hypothetical protein
MGTILSVEKKKKEGRRQKVIERVRASPERVEDSFFRPLRGLSVTSQVLCAMRVGGGKGEKARGGRAFERTKEREREGGNPPLCPTQG